MLTTIIIIGALIAIGCLGSLFEYLSKCRETKAVLQREKLKEFEREKYEVDQQRIRNEKARAAIDILANEKSLGFPWLANAYADYYHLLDLELANHLTTKDRPAIKGAEAVRAVSRERRKAEKLRRIFQYQLDYYERLFPWLIEFKSDDAEELIHRILQGPSDDDGQTDSADDPAKEWLTTAEYKTLAAVEKYQIALDRYWQKRKSKWEIGRDYERYVGFLKEQEGYSVYYQGIVAGFSDLGRDLIAKRGENTEIIQCKCWSKNKTIHEKHIFQLFGTTVEYFLKHIHRHTQIQLYMFPELLNRAMIKPVFYTTTTLSDIAQEFAAVLKVEVNQNCDLLPYPCIKCNVSKRTSEKIYHLPFDQQYDKTLIEEEFNECYVGTVKEAEDLGFRRAFRWRGNTRYPTCYERSQSGNGYRRYFFHVERSGQPAIRGHSHKILASSTRRSVSILRHVL